MKDQTSNNSVSHRRFVSGGVSNMYLLEVFRSIFSRFFLSSSTIFLYFCKFERKKTELFPPCHPSIIYMRKQQSLSPTGTLQKNKVFHIVHLESRVAY